MGISLIKNLVSLTAAEAFCKLITFAAFAYLARICGPAGFGYIEWSASVVMCASLIVDQGFSSYGAREIARNPAQTEGLVIEIVTARFLMAGVGYVAISSFAFIFVHEELVFTLLLIYGLSLSILPLMLNWVFQGHDRMSYAGLIQIVRQLVFVAVVFGFVRSSEELVFVGIAEIAAVLFAASLSVWLYIRNFAGKLNLRPRLSKELFREAFPIGLSQMFWVTRMFGATLILGLVATAEDTGYFGGAMRILIAIHTFVWLYYFNLLPSLSRAWVAGQPEFVRLIRNSILLVAIGSTGIGILWVVAAPLTMTTAYGQSFSNGGGALQLMMGVWVAAALSGHFRFGLIAAGRQKHEMATSALGALITIVLIPFGYFLFGISGAATALVISELAVLLFSGLLARRFLFRRDVGHLEIGSGRLQKVPGMRR